MKISKRAQPARMAQDEFIVAVQLEMKILCQVSGRDPGTILIVVALSEYFLRGRKERESASE